MKFQRFIDRRYDAYKPPEKKKKPTEAEKKISKAQGHVESAKRGEHDGSFVHKIGKNKKK